MDTAQRLSRTLHALRTLEPRPDLILATGDLTQNGMKSEYAHLRGMLAELDIPVFPCMGNHDARETFRIAFGHVSNQVERLGFVQYAVDGFPLRLIVLDTVKAGSDEPAFCAARLQWLSDELARSDEPVVIGMHHPPFATGVGWVDAQHREWSAELGSVLAECGRVRAILCGHVHRSIHRLWHGIPVSTAPAVAPQVALALAPRAPASFSLESPGFLLHRWDGDQLITYTVSVDGFEDGIHL
jgi:3',5'-cyclic AMP phosphodiesterase CpdA